MASPFILNVKLRVQDVIGLEAAKKQISQSVVSTNVSIPAVVSPTDVKTTQQHAQALNNAAKATTNLGNKSNQAVSSTNKAAAATTKAGRAVQTFGEQVSLAGRRYGAFVAATSVAFKAVQLIRAGTTTVIDFDKAVVNLNQILQETPQQIEKLKQTILDLSVTTGTSVEQLSATAKILAQTGRSGEELTPILEQLAKVPLSPTFESIETATEGVIAALNIFKQDGLTAESVFDKLTNVSNNFAASSEDIAQALFKGGAAFSAVGGNLDELIGVFTTIRSTSRESASAVATSIKTISSRLADPKIVDFLESKGIDLTIDGDFVGPIQAIVNISSKIKSLGGDVLAANEILNKLGGRRQFSRVASLAANTDVLADAIDKSRNSSGAFNRVTEEGLTTVDAKIKILISSAKKLAVEFGPDLFLPAIDGAIRLGNVAIGLLDAFKPILPVVGELVGLLVTASALKFVGVKGLAALGGASALGLGATTSASSIIAARAAGDIGSPRNRPGGFGSRARAIGSSPFVQAGLIVAASELVQSLFGLEEAANQASIGFLSTFSAITAFTLLLKKQSLGQFVSGGGAFGTGAGVAGGLATAGIAALGLGIFAAKQAVDDTAQTIIDSAIQSVKKLNIDAQNLSSDKVNENIKKFGDNIEGSLAQFVDSFDPNVVGISNSESFKRSLASVGTQIGNLIDLDFESLTSRGGIGQEDIKEKINEIIKSNKSFVDQLILNTANEIRDAQGDISALGRSSIAQQFVDSGKTESSAEGLTNAIVNSVGGLAAFATQLQENVDKIREESRAREDFILLQKTLIPQTLGGELIAFARAVQETTSLITRANSSFDQQQNLISGNISAPNVPQQFATGDILKGVSSGALSGLLGDFPSIQEALKATEQINDLIERFVAKLAKSETALTQQAIDIAIDDVISQVDGLSGKLETSIRSLLKTTISEFSELDGGLDKILNPTALVDAIKDNLENIQLEIPDFVLKQIQELLNNISQATQLELKGFASIATQRSSQGVSRPAQANDLVQALNQLGIKLEKNTTTIIENGRLVAQVSGSGALPGNVRPDDVSTANRNITVIGRNSSVTEQLTSRFTSLIEQISKTTTDLNNLSVDPVEANDRLKTLGKELIQVQEAMKLFKNSIEIARQEQLKAARERIQEDFRTRREDLQTRSLDLSSTSGFTERDRQQQLDLLRTEEPEALRRVEQDVNRQANQQLDALGEARTKAAEIIVEQTKLQITGFQIFDNAVTKFDGSISTLISTLEFFKRLGEGTLGDGSFTVTPPEPGTDPVRSLADAQRQLQSEQESDLQRTRSVLPSSITDVANPTQEELSAAIKILSDKFDGTTIELSNLNKLLEDGQATIIENNGDSGNREPLDNSKIDELNESLGNLSETIQEPSQVSVNTDNKVNVDVTGLGDELSENLLPQFREAAREAAVLVVKRVLTNLIQGSDTESGINFNNALDDLA